jgi:transposase
MWTAETRRTYDRKGLRYPTDGTDAEWELARPFIDVAQRGPGRQRRVDLREVLNAVFYVLGTGCQWRAGHGLPVACWARAARGVLCPRTCPRAAPCTTTLCVGSVTARWGDFITRSTSKRASWPARRPAPRRRSWTARA